MILKDVFDVYWLFAPRNKKIGSQTQPSPPLTCETYLPTMCLSVRPQSSKQGMKIELKVL